VSALQSERAIRLEPAGADEEPAMLMTSMIDVIFIVLAFFVCVSEVKKGQLKVQLPEAPQSEQQDAGDAAELEPILVTVTGDDRIFVGGNPVKSDDELAIVLAQAVERVGKDAPVHLSGDRNAKNGTMMRVVGQLSKAGLTRIEFAVQAGG
jgi:biopolymer transport protein TolR